jgi:hypothetical protein
MRVGPRLIAEERAAFTNVFQTAVFSRIVHTLSIYRPSLADPKGWNQYMLTYRLNYTSRLLIQNSCKLSKSL